MRLACGTQEGGIHVWEFSHPTEIQHSVLTHRDCTTAVI